MSHYPPPRYRAPSMRAGRAVAMSRAELLNSIHSLSSGRSKPASVYSDGHNADYYFGTSKTQRRLHNVRRWLYNPASGEVMGRTCVRWVQLLVFYIGFYSVLAGLFAAFLGLFMFAVIMHDFPHLTGQQSMLKLSPGLGVIPQPDYLTSLIAFKIQKDSYRKYTDDIVAFTQWYEPYGQAAVMTGTDRQPEGTDGGFAKCPRSIEDSIMDTRRSCRQPLNFAGRCNIFQEFGYDEGMPCILLTLNRIYGWMPDPLDNHTGVLVKCYGLNDVDKDLLGNICYHDNNDPEGKDLCQNDYGEFKSYYFPYLRQLTYQSPIVLVEFMNPRRNTIIMIECRAYAKNIPYNRLTGEGSVRFELLID